MTRSIQGSAALLSFQQSLSSFSLSVVLIPLNQCLYVELLCAQEMTLVIDKERESSSKFLCNNAGYLLHAADVDLEACSTIRRLTKEDLISELSPFKTLCECREHEYCIREAKIPSFVNNK